ncbi:MAG: TlpA family protein disulfide reductase [Deltaproteobacteria bacterium]|nr:TlpA family protein disulfide reductase [Deltaproteobacteria bacterium]
MPRPAATVRVDRASDVLRPRVLAALALAALASCGHGGPPPPSGDVAAELTLGTLDGTGSFDPATLKGKAALVVFWRPGCPYCATELPDALKVARAAGAEPIAVMIRPQVEGARDRGAKEMARLQWDGTALADTADLLGTWKIDGVPWTLVIKPDGTAERLFVGLASADDLARALAAAK